ncbi:DUF6087 family protein [Streptomyces niveus]|uniref:DUF6087 family protein n=1 Tax=Streptomyces niveus TaxID=193462 RepID=UPI00343E83D9
MYDEEPLDVWARRREERRSASMGRLWTVPLIDGPPRGAHVEPGAPRAIQQWDGTQWLAMGVAEDLAAANSLLRSLELVEQRPAGWDRPAVERGQGRHRKPDPANEQNC